MVRPDNRAKLFPLVLSGILFGVFLCKLSEWFFTKGAAPIMPSLGDLIPLAIIIFAVLVKFRGW